MTSSSTAVRSGRLRWPASIAQRGTLRSLLQHLGVLGPAPRGSKLSRCGSLRRPALRDRGRWAGWSQHQQGGPAEGGGGLLCARSTSFASLSIFLISPTALSHPPPLSGKEMNSEKGPQGHTVGLDLNVRPGTIWVSKI